MPNKNAVDVSKDNVTPGNYASLTDYLSYLNSVSSKSSKFLTGNFYSYSYKFDREDKNFDELKWYDKNPLIYLISTGPADNTYVGLNLHHLPVKARLTWLKRFDKISLILKADVRSFQYYEIIKLLFKKATFGVRMYRKDRIMNLRRVDSTKMIELSKFYSKTHLGVSIDSIEVLYGSFQPS